MFDMFQNEPFRFCIFLSMMLKNIAKTLSLRKVFK